MRLPEKLRIGAVIYGLEFNSIPDGNQQEAHTSFVNRVIRFGALCSKEALPEVLIHEILHAVNDDRALEMDERMIKSLANGLTVVLQELGMLPEEIERP